MVSMKKGNGRAQPMPVGLGVGAVVATGVTLLSSALLANLVLSQKLSEGALGYGVMVVLLLSSALGSWIAAKLIKRRWMIMCFGAGGSYFAILLAMNALFFGGQYQGVGVTALMILGGSGAVGLLGLKQGTGSFKKRAKLHSR